MTKVNCQPFAICAVQFRSWFQNTIKIRVPRPLSLGKWSNLRNMFKWLKPPTLDTDVPKVPCHQMWAPKSELAPGRTGDQIDMNTMCLSEKEFMARRWFQRFLVCTNWFIIPIHTVLHDAGIKLCTYRPPVLEHKDYSILKLRSLTLRMLVLKNEGAPLPGCHSQVPSSYMHFSGWCNYPLVGLCTWLTWCQVGKPKGSRCWLTQSTLQVFVVQSCHFVFLYPKNHPWEQHFQQGEGKWILRRQIYCGGEVYINKIQHILRIGSWTFSSRIGMG